MRNALTLLAGLALAGVAVAADPIDEKNAIKLTPSKDEIKSVDVTLYQDGTNEEQICIYKMTLSKGKPYTIWLEGEDAESNDIYIDWTYPELPTSDAYVEPEASFEPVDCGEERRWIVDGKSWGGSWGGDGGWTDGGDDEDITPEPDEPAIEVNKTASKSVDVQVVSMTGPIRL